MRGYVWCLVLLACFAAARAAGPAKPGNLVTQMHCDHISSQPTADGGRVFTLRDHVKLRAEQVGTLQATVNVAADRVTAVIAPGGEANQLPLNKLFARGHITIDGETHNAAKGVDQTFELHCERAEYSSADEVLRLYGTDDAPITGFGTQTDRPTAENGLKEPRTIRIDMEARQTAEIAFRELSEEDLANLQP